MRHDPDSSPESLGMLLHFRLTVLVLSVALFAAAPVMGSDLFWYDTNTPRVQRCDVSSCTPADFATPLSAIPHGDMAVDPLEGMVYWVVAGSSPGTSKVQRKSLSGGAVEDIFDLSTIPSSTIQGMVVDPVARHVYVSTPSTSTRIHRFSIDSPTVPTSFVVFNEAGCFCSPQGLALDLANGFLYFAEQTGGRIARKALDLSSAIEDVVTGVSTVRGLALDVANDRIYFTYHINPTTRLGYALLSNPTTIVDLVDPLLGAGANGGWGGSLEHDASAGTLGEMYIALTGDQEIVHCNLDTGCPSLTLLTSGMQANVGLAMLVSVPIPAVGWRGVTGLGALLVVTALATVVRRPARSGRLY
jgi:hypothetical protein